MKTIQKKSTYHRPTGFSLVEVLVAISILLIVIVGPMEIVVQSTRSAEFSTEQATAFFLAQEGVELLVNLRDQYMLAYYAGQFDGGNNFGPDDGTTQPWNDYLQAIDDCINNALGCFVSNDIKPPSSVDTMLDREEYIFIESCSLGSCQLEIDESNSSRSLYTNSSGSGEQSTPYTRRVVVTQVTGDQILVESTVLWRSQSRISESEVQVQSYIFNVYDLP